MASIKTLVERKRGCGYRKPGGLYMVGGTISAPCGKLPIPLTVCPCCGAGIKFSRGFTWISSKIVEDAQCSKAVSSHADSCFGCKFADGANKIEEYGLLWVGESFYKTPAKFLTEASIAGISKRIASVPRKFVIGKTWVLLAHIHAITTIHTNDGEVHGLGSLKDIVTHQKGIFSAFRPSEIQYVVTGKETEEELNEKEARGITLVKVVRDTEAQKSFDDVLITYEYIVRKKGKKERRTIQARNKKQASRQIEKKNKQEGVKFVLSSLRRLGNDIREKVLES